MPHDRIYTAPLLALARSFPAVAVLGARQIGKSTLARLAFPSCSWLDLERPDDLVRLERDPLFVLEQEQRWVIDEAQPLSALFPVLRHWLDGNERRRAVLLGSASPRLVPSLSESLTGRVGVFELPGLSVFERPADALWLQGAFPRLHSSRPRARPETWFPSYLRTALEQDVPQLGVRATFSRLHTFLSMLAHSQGGISNLAGWASSLGVDYHTVAHWLDVFEGVLLVRRLQPWHANLGKRLVKSPKVYLRDTGLLHSLLGMGFGLKEILRQPKAGASFETFCIEQLVAHARRADPAAEAHYFRTATGVEVELILRLRGKQYPTELKLGTAMPSTRHLEVCLDDLGLERGYVVSRASGLRPITRTVKMGGLEDILRALRLVPG